MRRLLTIALFPWGGSPSSSASISSAGVIIILTGIGT